MNRRHLEYFLEVMKHKSIKQAAQAGNISPQGISKTIIELERELGCALFERDGKRLIPTKQAHRLVTHAQKILDEYRSIARDVGLTAPEKTVLRVLTEQDVPQYLGVEFIKAFAHEHPDILLNMVEMPHSMAVRQLSEGWGDLGILGGPLDAAEFTISYLYSNRFCAVIHKDNPLSACTVIRPEHLHNQKVAMRGRDFSLYNIHLNRMLQQGIEVDEVVETSSYHIIHGLARQNMAIGLSLDYVAQADRRPDTVIRPFEIDPPKMFFAVEVQDRILPPEAEVFKQFLISWMRDKKE